MDNKIMNDEIELFECTVRYSLQEKKDVASAVADGLIKVSLFRSEKNNVPGWRCGTHISHVKSTLKRRLEINFTKEEFELIQRKCGGNEKLSQISNEEKHLYDEILDRIMKMVPLIRLNGGKGLADYLDS